MRVVAAMVVVAGVACGEAAAAPPAVIRSGGPSAAADAKIAVVAASRPLAGRGFTVTSRSGKVVLRGRLRRATGSPKPWRYAATADLSAVRKPGSYRVRAAGLTSRTWRVANSRSQLVRRLLRIFQINSDGSEPNPVFGPSHLEDAIAPDGRRVDLTGGWRDAGDHLKFAATTAVAVAYLELAARLDPTDAAILRTTSDVGVRWLLKAHPAPGEFYAEVGDERDHSTGFRDPARDDADTRQGVGVRYAYTTTSANVLAKVAAALALAAARNDPKDALVATAKEWFAAALASGKVVPIASPFVSDFYPDPDVGDDIAFAATALYRATGEPTYAAQASAALAAGSDDQFYSGATVGTLGPIAAADICGGLGAPALPAPETACAGVRKVISAARERAAASAFATPGIVTFGWVQDHAAVGAVAAAAARAGVDANGAKLAATARDYLLGRNPWGRSFVVGPGAIDAKQPHHPGYLKGSPARLLDGAVVGGIADPASITSSGLKLAPGSLRRFNSPAAVYEDRRANFVTSEVGLAYSASAVLLLASLP